MQCRWRHLQNHVLRRCALHYRSRPHHDANFVYAHDDAHGDAQPNDDANNFKLHSDHGRVPGVLHSILFVCLWQYASLVECTIHDNAERGLLRLRRRIHERIDPIFEHDKPHEWLCRAHARDRVLRLRLNHQHLHTSARRPDDGGGGCHVNDTPKPWMPRRQCVAHVF